MARTKALYDGHAVAAVAAIDSATAEAALGLIEVEYEVLPHVTPVTAEIASGDLWAVDSSFFDNGEEPVLMPLKEWLAGWEPPNFKF